VFLHKCDTNLTAKYLLHYMDKGYKCSIMEICFTLTFMSLA
jgi:hypothetical protein